MAYSTVTGRIARVLVEHGEAVKAGQVLAEVESLELRNVQLDLLRAELQLKLSNKLLDQYRRLSTTGGIVEKDLWETQSETDNLQSTVASLRNKLSLMGLSDEEIQHIAGQDITEGATTEAIRTTCGIRSPIDGRITLFDLSIGQVVRPQDGLFEIHDTSSVVGARLRSRTRVGRRRRRSARDRDHYRRSAFLGRGQDQSHGPHVIGLGTRGQRMGRARQSLRRIKGRDARPPGDRAAGCASKTQPAPRVPNRSRIRRTRARVHDEFHGLNARFRASRRWRIAAGDTSRRGRRPGVRMLNRIIAMSLKNRMLVLALTFMLLVYGGYVAARLPIDVFPDLNRPTVTILTEARDWRPKKSRRWSRSPSNRS